MEAIKEIDVWIKETEEREAEVKNINREGSKQEHKVEAGQDRQ